MVVVNLIFRMQLRWVLGEQSVKSLRGSNMADVIFAGSQDRRAQNLAEVTLDL